MTRVTRTKFKHREIMLIDTHAHLDFAQYDHRHDEVLNRAHQAGVEKVINVGTSLSGSQSSIRLALKYPEIYAACGIHPSEVEAETLRKTLAEILQLAQNKKVVAIGEVGLDYYKKDANRQLQQEAFIAQLGIAKRLQLPVIIHNREADKDVLDILKRHDHNLSGVIHCFSSSWPIAQKFLALGFYISFTGIITFTNKNHPTVKRGSSSQGGIFEVVQKVPLERVMVETDCPFLTPWPYRGKINEPAYVREIAKKIAAIKGIAFEEVCRMTSKNAENLFKFRTYR